MKKTILMGAALLLMLISNAQQVQFDKADLKVDEPVANNNGGSRTRRVTVNLMATSLPAAPLTATFSIDAASTYPAASYTLLSPTAAFTLSTNNVISFDLSTAPYSNEDGYLLLNLNYADAAGRTRTVVDTLHIINTYPQKAKQQTTDIENNNIMLLNAYNLNFGDAKLSSNYVGMLNLFAPNISTRRWGFNTGVMKINYAQDSGISDRTVAENLLKKPFDVVTDGYVYKRQLNRYKTDLKNTIWSFYFQPLFELTNRGSKQHVYLHGHFELLVSKWKETVTVEKLFEDSAVYNSQKPVYVRPDVPVGPFNRSTLSGYFGVGATLDARPWNGGAFFFQFTVGTTSNQPNPSSVDINTTPPSTYLKPHSARLWENFYLVRAHYKHVITGSTTLMVGVDIRGLFPMYAPQYAAYAGLNLKLEKLAELIGFKKE